MPGSDLKIEHDESRTRFTVTVDGHTAVLRYRPIDERTLDYRSTFVPPPLRKRGVGLQLVEHALAYARDHGFEVVPSCWFVKDVMEDRDES